MEPRNNLGFPGGSDCKESASQCGRPEFNLWVGEIPWGRKWVLTPVFLPREFHGQGNLTGYSPWGHKELDTTEHLNNSDRNHSHYFYKHINPPLGYFLLSRINQTPNEMHSLPSTCVSRIFACELHFSVLSFAKSLSFLKFIKDTH